MLQCGRFCFPISAFIIPLIEGQLGTALLCLVACVASGGLLSTGAGQEQIKGPFKRCAYWGEEENVTSSVGYIERGQEPGLGEKEAFMTGNDAF